MVLEQTAPPKTEWSAPLNLQSDLMNTSENKTTIHTLLRRNGARKHPIESAKSTARTKISLKEKALSSKHSF